jgi:hypothetical protein
MMISSGNLLVFSGESGISALTEIYGVFQASIAGKPQCRSVKRRVPPKDRSLRQLLQILHTPDNLWVHV